MADESGSARHRSAGILLFRWRGDEVEVLLGHMGGPWWARRDRGAWTIPKGEYRADEPAEAAARREFREELGVSVPDGELLELGDVRQAGGKLVTAWAVEGFVDLNSMEFGTFDMEWPRGSGRLRRFPELDRVEWFGLEAADEKMVTAQREFLDRLREHLNPR